MKFAKRRPAHPRLKSGRPRAGSSLPKARGRSLGRRRMAGLPENRDLGRRECLELKAAVAVFESRGSRRRGTGLPGVALRGERKEAPVGLPVRPGPKRGLEAGPRNLRNRKSMLARFGQGQAGLSLQAPAQAGGNPRLQAGLQPGLWRRKGPQKQIGPKSPVRQSA